jgi:hypothetical protein
MSQPLALNGLNASTGQPLDDLALTPELLAQAARQGRLSPEALRDAKLRRAHDQSNDIQFGVGEGIDIADLAQAGWGIIFPAELPAGQVAALKDALRPLLTLRQAQAARLDPGFYREFIGPELGYRAGESKNAFLKRFGRGPGAADPAQGVPFYLLLVGSPEAIPFEFQYLLDVQYGVGRLHFECLEDYARYAQSVVQAETQPRPRLPRAVFFGPSHDAATRLSAPHLVAPLAARLAARHPAWQVQTLPPEQCTKSALGGLLGGAETPALLFTAGHGLGFKLDDPRLLPHTGALLCQDYTAHRGGRIPEQFYLSADDISAQADVSGLLAFFFACYGAGSPRTDSLARQALGQERVIAPYAFLSRLPLKLLAHPRGGALGVFAHIDRALGYSFLWDDRQAIADVETFRSLLSALINGKPAGAAGDYFGARYGELSTLLNEELNAAPGGPADEARLAWWWSATHDARNYTFIGDPAVRLAL